MTEIRTARLLLRRAVPSDLDAVHAFIAHAFATHDIPEMTADADPHNEASLGLLRKLGFVETGRAERTFLIGGEWFDSVYLALRRPS